ncbi:WD40-repeat-containing domain protein [Mycena metata]|uniref:WD40-repeat-containing domain protein n=1 Tax=Mycena metata TaxID=1033252 RepID=A0AAD7HYH6_9AGAR|nr:WD40-repeat-containing domain protein [Mycena metata]
MSGGEYKVFAELTVSNMTAGPVNCLLFIKDATILVSGGDDQVLRVWTIETGECFQELRDPRWGQITALSWLPGQFQVDESAVLFIGTGRGVVSTYPFSNERTQFVRQASSTCTVFSLDDSVEVQAMDASNSRFAVASHSGEIYPAASSFLAIKANASSFTPAAWETCTYFSPAPISTVLTIPLVFIATPTPGISSTRENYMGACKLVQAPAMTYLTLRSISGSAALSAYDDMKGVHNLSSGNFDIYKPADSLHPMTLRIPTSDRFIKQCVFAEDGRILVCGGDHGTLHLFQLGESPQRTTLCGEAADQAFSTPDYHYIAGGESEEPATIFVWRKPTKKRAAENRMIRKLQADQETVVHQAAKKEMEAQALREKLADMEELLQSTQNRSRNAWLVGALIAIAILVIGLYPAHRDGYLRLPLHLL